MDLSYIIPPVPRELIKKELSKKIFLRHTNHGGKEIYVTTAALSPNIMQEIGRLRELSFATEGGGTGNPVDMSSTPCRNLIVSSNFLCGTLKTRRLLADTVSFMARICSVLSMALSILRQPNCSISPMSS